MAKALKVSCIQHCASGDTDKNLTTLDKLITKAAKAGAQLICLPEYATCYGTRRGQLEVGAEPEHRHPGLAMLRDIATKHGCWLLIGSIGIRREDGLINNRSYLIDDAGSIRARYDKVHLFDVDLEGGESYRESDSIKPGDKAVLVDTPFGRLGLTICYDLRFPQLYRTLAKAGADILFAPAAFTRKTGTAHWHTLVTARAIETGAYLVAPCQCGDVKGKLARYGHSLIVDPWGEILADGGDKAGVIDACLDLEKVSAARQQIPALRHDRLVEIELIDSDSRDTACTTSHPGAS
jgi:predicted amidohydrolase